MSLRLRSIPSFMLVLCSATAVTVACGKDSEEGDDHSGPAPQSCKDISDVCHDLDSGSGMAHDCHETSHENDEAACDAVHDECIAFCTGAATGSESGTTMTSTTMTSTTDAPTSTESGSNTDTDAETTDVSTESSSGHHDESSTAADHGTGDTGAGVCDEIGTGCHDIKTPEGQECHDLGHDGDEAACQKAYEMCAKICGL